MENVKEVLIVSDSGSKDANCNLYDLDTGNLIETYKEGHSTKNGLDMIGHDYLISAFEDRPKIKIWQLGHSSKEPFKINAPGVVSALAVSKCGQYCVAGIGPSAYIWEVASGNLESCLENHLQDITCVRFSSDSSYFMTGGKDGTVFVFYLTDAIKKQSRPSATEPLFTWTDHTNEVTDIYVGYMGPYSRVVTTSLDRTCRIYELDTGYPLCTIHMKYPLTCACFDLCEYFLFLGTDEGNIYKINLFNVPDANLHFEDVGEQNAYVGHKKEITSLCVSHSGCYLVSGSRDKTCRLWDISNFSCMRQMNFPGPVTNVITCRVPPAIVNKSYLPRLCVNHFKKENSSTNDEDPAINLVSQKLTVFHHGDPDQFLHPNYLNCPGDKASKMIKGSYSIDELSSVNNSMYSFAITEILANAPPAEEE